MSLRAFFSIAAAHTTNTIRCLKRYPLPERQLSKAVEGDREMMMLMSTSVRRACELGLAGYRRPFCCGARK